MLKKQRASSCNAKLTKIRAILKSRTPHVLAIDAITAVLSGRKLRWKNRWM